MSKFKVGDRVSVAGWTHHGNCPLGASAEVTRIGEHHPEIVHIKWLSGVNVGAEDAVHERQCRRLVKRERRRVWVGLRMYKLENCEDAFYEARCKKPAEFEKTADGKPWIEFVEVKPKRGEG